MNKRILLSAILICAIAQLRAQDADVSDPALSNDSIFWVTFSDTFNKDVSAQSPMLKVPILSKEERISSEATNIKIIFVDEANTPPEVVTCANLAASIWGSRIKASHDITIELKYNNLLVDGDIVTDVSYNDKEGMFYPVAMAVNGNIENQKCGIIEINGNVDWDYSVGETVDMSKCNLTFGLLRAISRILGFGSSARVNDKQQFTFYPFDGHTIFNSKIVSSDGVKLSEIPTNIRRNNPALQEFLNFPGRNFYFTDGIEKFELATGSYTPYNPPLTALKGGLMCADISAGDYFIDVDDDVWKCMEIIGWPMERDDEIKIMCDDTDSTGLMDAFSNHTFYLNNANVPISGGKWTLTLPGKNGEDIITTYPGNSGRCEISALSKNDIYSHDADGLVKGRLEFKGNIDGIPMKLYPYTIYFESAPRILDAKILGFEFSEDGEHLRAKFQVRYYGADKIEMYTEEEYGSVAQAQVIREPAIATSTSGWMYAGGYTWLNFIVKNNYGRAVYILEIEPYATDWYPLENPEEYLAPGNSSIEETDSFTEVNSVMDAYDIFGRKIWSGSSIDNLKSAGHKGVVILRTSKNGKTRTVKTLL